MLAKNANFDGKKITYSIVCKLNLFIKQLNHPLPASLEPDQLGDATQQDVKTGVDLMSISNHLQVRMQ